MIVVDASAVLELLLWTERGQEVARRINSSGSTLHAPHLLSVEIAQVLRRLDRTNAISTKRARAAIEDLPDLDINLYDHQVLLPRIWALRNNLTAYDAAYVALAEALDAPLMTFDARLAKSPGAKIKHIVP